MKPTEHAAPPPRKPELQNFPRTFWERGDLVVLSVFGAIIAIAALGCLLMFPGTVPSQNCAFASSIVSTCN